MERKSFVQLKAIDDEGVGLARIATLNVIDSDGDITIPGAFGEQRVKVLPTHNWGAVPLGKARVFEKGDEVLAEFKINLDTTAGKDWHSALKFDLEDGKGLIEWSYGFTIEESDTETRDGEKVRILKKLTVHEVSPVMLGAGVDTGTLAIKGDERQGGVVENHRLSLGGPSTMLFVEKSGLSLLDQIKAALSDVEAVNERLAEVMVLRAKDSRSLGEDSTVVARDLEDALDRTKTLSEKLVSIIFKGSPEDAGRLLAEYTATITHRRILSGKGGKEHPYLNPDLR